MNHLPGRGHLKTWAAIAAQTILTASVMLAVTPSNTKTFTAGEKAEVKGVIISHDGDVLKIRGEDEAIDTVELTNDTKIQFKHGLFSKTTMESSALVPGLRIEAKGKGNDKGDLVAEKVLSDRVSMRTSRQIDTRVSPLEARTGSVENRAGQLEGRAGQLENRAGQIEGKQSELENTEKQTQAQVGQVKTSADQANEGVNTVNGRVTNLDNYDPKENVTVYFRVNSVVLTAQAKKDLDELAAKAKNEKGYMVEVAGFADKTGSVNLNQELSQRRADAVIHYLEQNGDIPIHRILAPAGLGTSHEVADNNTSAGRKLNRRVEVRVLVNQGLVGGSPNSAQTNSAPPPTSGPSAAPNSATTTTNPPPQQ